MADAVTQSLPDLLLDRLKTAGKDAQSDTFRRLTESIDRLNSSFGKAKFDSPSPGADAGKGSIGNVLSGFDGVFGQVLGKLSDTFGQFQANISAVLGYVQKAASYVSEFNPAAVQRMNDAFRDFSATIGVALTPVVEAATRYSRELGSVLLPVMQQLQPVVARLASTFLQLTQNGMPALSRMLAALSQTADQMASMAVSLAPAIEGLQAIGRVALQVSLGALQGLTATFRLLETPLRNLGAFVEALSPVFDALTAHLSGMQAVLGAVLTGVQSAFSGLLGTVNGSGLRSAMETLARSALLAGAHLAKLFGVQAAYIQGVIKAFEPGDRQNNTGLASIQNTSFQSFADFGKNVSLAASKASGGSPEMTKEERDTAWQQSLLTELKELAKGDGPARKISEEIKGWLKEEIKATARDLVDGFNPLRVESQGLFNRAARTAAGPLLGRLIP